MPTKRKTHLHPIAYQLATARRAAGYESRYALSQASSIPEATIRRAETATPEAPPMLPTIERICEAIGWELSLVISREDGRAHDPRATPGYIAPMGPTGTTCSHVRPTRPTDSFSDDIQGPGDTFLHGGCARIAQPPSHQSDVGCPAFFLSRGTTMNPNEQIEQAAAAEMAAGPNGTGDAENIFGGPPVGSKSELTVFDIETEGLPAAELTDWMPKRSEFDPAAVKVGNLKDPLKIDAKVNQAKAQHEADYQERCNAVVEGAALDPMTGRVVAIGYLRADHEYRIHGIHKSEPQFEPCILTRFWQHYLYCHRRRTHLVGFNSNGFDLPFLIKRSWYWGVDVPPSVLVRGRFDPTFVDLMVEFGCGKHNAYISLDKVAHFFDVGGKPDDCTGADFARLWASNKSEDFAAAVRYLRNDLEMTWHVAHRMGIAPRLATKTEDKQDGNGIDNDKSRETEATTAATQA